MVVAFDYETLKEKLLKDGKLKSHSTGNAYDLLPISQNSKLIRGNFSESLGEFVRKITKSKVKQVKPKDTDTKMETDVDFITEYIAENMEFNSDDERYDFIKLINSYLFSSDQLIVAVHPFLYNFMNVESNKYNKYAVFLSDIFVNDNEDIKQLFESNESDNIVIKVILDKIKQLRVKDSKEVQHTFVNMLPNFTALYQKDLLYLSKNKDKFLKDFPLLTHFYAFMYMIQLLVQFNLFEKADYSKCEPLYFALDWETISKRRSAAKELNSYKLIKEHLSDLFAHIHALSQLSYNTISMQEDKNMVFGYSDLWSKIQLEGPEYEANFIREFKSWILEYRKSIDAPSICDMPITNDYPSLIRLFFDSLKIGTSDSVRKKNGETIENMGADAFLKARGSLGSLFNIRHDLLMLLTGVIVKDERKPLKIVFEEFEKRGIKFDRYSKQEIIVLYNSHNMLDKKSDSGDAQYVKPIL